MNNKKNKFIEKLETLQLELLSSSSLSSSLSSLDFFLGASPVSWISVLNFFAFDRLATSDDDPIRANHSTGVLSFGLPLSVSKPSLTSFFFRTA